MKKTWEHPAILVQQFEANEYVAACWGVGCSVNDANSIEQSMGNYNSNSLYHDADHCGLSGNQVIYDDNNDGVADRMVEVGTDGLGTLSCTIYMDASYTTQKSIGSVKAGDTIYWTTSAGNGWNKKTWHHVGTGFDTVPGHPNRS